MRARIGPYRIEKVLAEGGMGVVYKGHHDGLGRCAAIKTFLPKHAGDAGFRRRLAHEAQAQARLQHPNIVTVYDLIDEGGDLFIAMEYVDGETLAALLDRAPRHRLPLTEALPLFTQVLDALEYVHGAQIVHRDIKPSNVMVRDGHVKLADFGIALLAGSPRLTTSLKVIGSRLYMSPEQLQAKDIDYRSDIYGAALVLYRMLAGRCAFEAQELLAQLHEQMAGAPDLRSIVPELPAGVCEAVAVALHEDREQRFSSVAVFRDALREGAVGFRLADATTVVLDDAATEPLQPLPEPEPHRGLAYLTWSVIAGSLVAAVYIAVSLTHERFPQVAPRTISTTQLIALPAPLDPAPPSAQQPSQQPAVPATKDPSLVAEPTPPPPTTDATAEREAAMRREVETLRDELRRAFAGVEADLRMENFDAATRSLDDIAEKAQRHPDDLWQERDEVARLRARVVDLQLAARRRTDEAATWESRLADIDEDIVAGRYVEAERFAKKIVDDPRAPAAIAARAQALLQKAKDAFKAVFNETHVGTTTNTIRKPSPPPRKELED